MGVLSDIMNDVIDTAVQKTGQGAAELAAAIFSQSDAMVQYGSGQLPMEPNKSAEAPAVEAPVVEQAIQEQSRGMEI